MPYIQSPIPGGVSLPFDCTKTKSRKSSRFTAHRLFWIFNFNFNFSFAMLAPNKKLSVFVFCNQLSAVAFNRFIQFITLIIQHISNLSTRIIMRVSLHLPLFACILIRVRSPPFATYEHLDGLLLPIRHTFHMACRETCLP